MFKIVVLYESYFGNTFGIAKVVAETLNNLHATELCRISETKWKKISDADLYIVGAPTRGFRPCEKTAQFLKSIPANGLAGKKVAVFDTRIYLPSIKSKFFRYLVNKGGYAAKHMAKSLVKNGGKLVVPPQGFLVAGEKGPLVDGELERAENWARKIVNV